MNRSINSAVLLCLFFSLTVWSQEVETFYLKSGEKVIGTVLDKNDSTGVFTIESAYGTITLNQSDIKATLVEVSMKTGELIKGELLKEDDLSIVIQSALGELTLARDKVDRIIFPNSNNDATMRTLKESSNSSRWYYGDERLIDVFFDPTGYTLEANTLYFSGFSWGYAVTDKVHFSSKWTGYFVGDLNIRPKIMVYRSGDIKAEEALSIGAHFHSRGLPSKYEYIVEDIEDDRGYWQPIGEYDEIADDKFWFEVFGAFTKSYLKPSGHGRTNVTLGGSLTKLPNYDIMPRIYGAFTSDVRKNLQLLAEVYFDPYYPSTYDLIEEKNSGADLGMDFGFNYAYNENLRFGIHYQRPWLAIYYKF